MVDQVHRALRSAIVEVRLRPGSALSEKEIAACLNVSKTPIREALIRLVEERLVMVVPKSGTRVSTIDIDRFREGCFARLHIEVAAVAQAATLRTDEHIIQMKANLSRQRDALEREAYWDFFLCDEQFHALILKAAGLSGLVPIMEAAKVEVDRIRSLKNRLGVRRTEIVIREHEAIVSAIAARDPGRASQAIREHLGEVDQRIWALGEDHVLWSFIESVSKVPGRNSLGIAG
ncbi:GntR family transcriptional regulator [Rhizobium sp. XQZ8]|nr:GntR family transcriptional regulator [Rhizobium populisoli]